MKKAFIQLHIAVFLAGLTGVLGKLITLNEGLLVWYRLLLASVILLLLMSYKKKLEKLSLRQILPIIGIGVLSALHWLFFFASIKYANVSVGLVCLSAVGFFSAILEPIIFKKRINLVEVLFGLASIFGIYLIFHFDTTYKVGIALGIISSLFASLFPILLKRSMQTISMPSVLTWQMIGGFLFVSAILPFYLHAFPVATLWPSWQDWVWLLVLAWLCSVVAFQFSFKALKKLSAFTLSLSYNMEPIYGIIMAFVLFKENKDLNQGFYIGFSIILTTLILHTILLVKSNRKLQQDLQQISE